MKPLGRLIPQEQVPTLEHAKSSSLKERIDIDLTELQSAREKINQQLDAWFQHLENIPEEERQELQKGCLLYILPTHLN